MPVQCSGIAASVQVIRRSGRQDGRNDPEGLKAGRSTMQQCRSRFGVLRLDGALDRMSLLYRHVAIVRWTFSGEPCLTPCCVSRQRFQSSVKLEHSKFLTGWRRLAIWNLARRLAVEFTPLTCSAPASAARAFQRACGSPRASPPGGGGRGGSCKASPECSSSCSGSPRRHSGRWGRG